MSSFFSDELEKRENIDRIFYSQDVKSEFLKLQQLFQDRFLAFTKDKFKETRDNTEKVILDYDDLNVHKIYKYPLSLAELPAILDKENKEVKTASTQKYGIKNDSERAQYNKLRRVFLSKWSETYPGVNTPDFHSGLAIDYIGPESPGANNSNINADSVYGFKCSDIYNTGKSYGDRERITDEILKPIMGDNFDNKCLKHIAYTPSRRGGKSSTKSKVKKSKKSKKLIGGMEQQPPSLHPGRVHMDDLVVGNEYEFLIRAPNETEGRIYHGTLMSLTHQNLDDPPFRISNYTINGVPQVGFHTFPRSFIAAIRAEPSAQQPSGGGKKKKAKKTKKVKKAKKSKKRKNSKNSKNSKKTKKSRKSKKSSKM